MNRKILTGMKGTYLFQDISHGTYVLAAGLVIVLILLSTGNSSWSEDKPDSKDEEKEIIKMLDMLENYELLISMDLYENMQDISDSQAMTEEDKGEKK